jgi:hypothetical protein
MNTGFGNIMKQAQEFQAKLQKVQEEIAATEVTGEAGAGMVKVIMNGRHEVNKVTIDPGLWTEDREMVEDLIAAAINDAAKKVERMTKDKMTDLTAGMGLPPGFKLPF